MEIETEKEYEFCEEIADSPRYKEHLDNGWEPVPGVLPKGELIALRRQISKSTKVRVPKELE